MKAAESDLLDAIEHAAQWRMEPWGLEDFRVIPGGNMSLRAIEGRADGDDFSSWLEIDPSDFEGLSRADRIEELQGFRGVEWAKRVPGWLAKGIPPVVLVEAPVYEDGQLVTIVGDGRGRINMALALGIKRLPVVLLRWRGKRSNPTSQGAALWKLEKSSPPKKWKVRVPSEGGSRLVRFGASGYEDYTQHKDPQRRANYRSRHRGDNLRDPYSPGFWSWHVLWGPTTSRQQNFKHAVRKAKTLLKGPRQNPEISRQRRRELIDYAIQQPDFGQEAGEYLLQQDRDEVEQILKGLSVPQLEDVAWALNQGATNALERGDATAVDEWQEKERWVDELAERAARRTNPGRKSGLARESDRDLMALFERFADVDLYISPEHNGRSELTKIVIPKAQRGTGHGSQVMAHVIHWADKHGIVLSLTPATDFGGSSVARLKRFYKRFGFVENKGRNRDYEISDTMYRTPR